VKNKHKVKMKIVQVNKFLYPKGGADKYCLTLIEELKKNGHELIPFGMADDNNIKSSWSSYFSEKIDYHRKGNNWKIASRLLWNKEAALKFGDLLDAAKPDIIHCHNIYHQLSPSILKEARKRKIPVVMTLHDYKLICPNYKLFTHGKNCERCIKGSVWNCLLHNCYNSYSRSALASLEGWLHTKAFPIYQEDVNLFISPSKFLKYKMWKAGWNEDSITVLNNPAPKFDPKPIGQNLLYFGRLTEEKGVDILIEALKLTDEKLDIVGTGPEEKKLKALSQKLKLEERIIFHGVKQGIELDNFINNAQAVILPSIWNENMPLVILESLAKGKIVIASKTGGTTELIEDGKTGYLFSPGDIATLANKIKDLKKMGAEEKEMMLNNIKEKIEPLSIEKHLKKLEDIYLSLKNR
jgi:glycosyltransferase involved in cell wall biosynthesis